MHLNSWNYFSEMKLVTLIIGSVLVLATSTFAFRDGEVYRITSAVDAKVSKLEMYLTI